MWQAEDDNIDQEQAVAQTAPEEAGADTDQQTSSSLEDTGETPEIQAEPPPSAVSQDASEIMADEEVGASPEASSAVTSEQNLTAPKEKSWQDHLARYYNDMNGLFAGKENLKIVAINTSARPSFYRKWSNEANQVLRVTANLRRRLKNAKQKAS